MAAGPEHASGPSKGTETADRTRRPEVGVPSATGEFAALAAGPVASLLTMQRKAGNTAVRRMVERRNSTIQREGEDGETTGATATKTGDSGYGGTKKSTPSKAEEKRRKAATVNVLPSGPTVFMDSSGVGRSAPDSLNSVVRDVLKIFENEHTNALADAANVILALFTWQGRLLLAQAKHDETIAAAAAGEAVWDVEAAASPATAAAEGEKADASAKIVKDHFDAVDAEAVAARQKAAAMGKRQAQLQKNLGQYAKDKPGWLRLASPITTLALQKIEELQASQAEKTLAAEAEAAKIDGEHAKFKALSDAAEAARKKAWTPLAPANTLWAVTGMLQQKLNATRADGAARLTVNALFNAKTKTALDAFQGTNGLTVSGKADAATVAALDLQAPSVMENGRLVVHSKEGANATAPLNGSIHPRLSFGSKGAAVREMQTRLNNWALAQGGAKPPFKALKVDGVFGFKDKAAVKIFQTAVNIVPGGEVGDVTWAQLDAVPGGITEGARQFDWREEVEGNANVGTTAAYDWELKDGKLTITVKIKWTGATSHPMVNKWMGDITEVWNNFKAVEVGAAPAREFNVDFKPVKASSSVHKVKAAKPPRDDPNPRSNSATWYVSDTDKGLAPHEFGHLIGLEDEYNRPEEQAASVSGLEPAVGPTLSTTGKGAKVIAKELHDVVVANAGGTGNDLMNALYAKLQEHGIMQGAFARRVAEWYETDHGLEGEADMARYLLKIGGRPRPRALAWVTKPFLVSNTSLMGTMGGMDAPDFGAIPAHEHPVQPRHIRPFSDLLKLAFPGTNWKPTRR